MRSRSATEVPPYFCTTSVTGSSHSRYGTAPPLRARAPAVLNEWPSSNHVAPARQGTSRENSTMASAAPDARHHRDPGELAKFAALGRDWWDTTGPMAPLHKLNPVRVAYIRDQACATFRARPRAAAGRWRACERSTSAAAAGCWPSRWRAWAPTSPAIDPVAAASRPQGGTPPRSGWRSPTGPSRSRPSARSGRQFDLVVASEVVEHVADVPEFLAAIAAVTRPGGLVVLSTLEPHAGRASSRPSSAPSMSWAGCRAARTTGAAS